FQAEDGIRDYKVTGVQTCALPIYFDMIQPVLVLMDPEKVPVESYQNFMNIIDGKSDAFSQLFIGAQGGGAAFGQVLLAKAEGIRSEERRVGKEGRSMRSANEYIEK